MPSEDVYGSSLAANPEGDLGSNIPSFHSKQTGHQLDEAGMVLVQQSVEPFALPVHANIDPGAKRLRNARQCLQGNSAAEATLDAGHD